MHYFNDQLHLRMRKYEKHFLPQLANFPTYTVTQNGLNLQMVLSNYWFDLKTKQSTNIWMLMYIVYKPDERKCILGWWNDLSVNWPAARMDCVPSMQCTRLLQHTHLALTSSYGRLPAGHHHQPVQTKYRNQKQEIVVENHYTIGCVFLQILGKREKKKEIFKVIAVNFKIS